MLTVTLYTRDVCPLCQKAEEELRKQSEEDGLKASEFIHHLRVAVSGIEKGPSLFEMLEVLGKDVVCRRLETAVKWIEIH